MVKREYRFLGVSDWKAVILCFLAASTFWFLNAMNEDYTSSISYPLKLNYDKDKVIPAKELPRTIKFNATGVGWDFLKKSFFLSLKPIQIAPTFLPERNYLTSTELLPLVNRQVGDIRVNYIIQDTLYFDFDRLGKKKIHLIADTSGINLKSDYKIVGMVNLIPDSIMISGQYGIIRSIPETLFVKLPLKDVREKTEVDINIEKNFPIDITLDHKKIRARVDVQAFVKEVQNVGTVQHNFPEDLLIQYTEKLILTYFVTEENKNKAVSTDFAAFLDIAQMDADSTIKPVLVQKPPYVTDYYFTPSAIKLNGK